MMGGSVLFAWVVLVLLVASAPRPVQGKVKFDHNGKVSLLGALQHATGWDAGGEDILLLQARPEPQQMKVIGAGQGRTGTTSLIKALSKIGLESYHMSKILETPGHLDLWHDYYVMKSVTLDLLIDRITQDGFNATMDAPLNYHYQHLMERYPEALVILSLRKDGAEGWVKSMFDSVFLIHPILRRPPLSWFPRAKSLREFFAAMNRELNVPLNEANLPKRQDLVPEYDRWARHVQETVPPEKLLVFYPQDGWKPLCDFLAPLSVEVERNCQKILGSGEPYPHANDKAFIKRLVFGLNLVLDVCQLVPALAGLFFVVRFVRSRSKTAKVKNL